MTHDDAPEHDGGPVLHVRLDRHVADRFPTAKYPILHVYVATPPMMGTSISFASANWPFDGAASEGHVDATVDQERVSERESRGCVMRG